MTGIWKKIWIVWKVGLQMSVTPKEKRQPDLFFFRLQEAWTRKKYGTHYSPWYPLFVPQINGTVTWFVIVKVSVWHWVVSDIPTPPVLCAPASTLTTDVDVVVGPVMTKVLKLNRVLSLHLLTQSPDLMYHFMFHFYVKFGYMECCDFSIDKPQNHFNNPRPSLTLNN